MKNQLLYRILARYYDFIFSSIRDFKKEASEVTRLIQLYKKSLGNELLDIGCGTAEHFRYLSKNFICTGIDTSPSMLAIAKKKVTKAKFFNADIKSFNLNKKFDIIISISVLAHLKNRKELKKAISNMSNHLKNGGVLILDPSINQQSLKTGSPYLSIYDGNDIKIARATIYNKTGKKATFDMHYLVAKYGEKKITHLISPHKLMLFPQNEIINSLKEEGIKSIRVINNWSKNRHTLIIASK